jgi:hydrogenase maturation protein HypF
VSAGGRRIEIRGIVQGVGFRPWVYRLATEEKLTGHVRNDTAGVTIEAFGSEDALDAFMHRLAAAPMPPAANIRELRSVVIPLAPATTFSILQSEERSERQAPIPPDLPTCHACLLELFDPADRRYRYPFINCTNCGPRFTITREVPYDRPATTMAAFAMCADCQREYDSVDDRRFHAQPNACPVCGPRLAVMTPSGTSIVCDDPIAMSGRILRAGGVVAVKGLGGFHLACDATSAFAVQRLRVRKRRDEKPFAIMVSDSRHADQIACLTDEERRLLESAERPIVLATGRQGTGVVTDVAPGSRLVGVLLPYTPLHHLLMREAERPLVMTSGNVSDEPMSFRNAEAVARLGGVVDLFLVHNRDIDTRCDDSVARVIARRPVVLRRARGYVPRSIAVSPRFDRPVLACGGLLKNTICIGVGDSAFLGPHIGDLENLDTFASFEESVHRMERFLNVTPDVVAYDLHPDYLSTRYAFGRSEATKIGVQHHHAHIVSAMAEHRLHGPVIGVAYDGTGFGTDGTAWGGEVMVASRDSFERVATFRPVSLAGGDAAIRHPWRIALALLEDAFEGQAPLDALHLFSKIPVPRLAVVRQMLATGVRSPRAHGVGRYFDGIGSLVLARLDSRYEGQIALEWNLVAAAAETGHYDYDIDWREPTWSIDLRPMVRAVMRDLLAGARAPIISARFHNTLVKATSEVVSAIVRRRSVFSVVLTGGCFQNPRLAEALAQALTSTCEVHLHRDVPPGDGGLALGQAVVAAALVRRRS